MSLYDLVEFSVRWFIAPCVLLAVSIVFFLANSRQEHILKRVLASIHGASISALYLIALLLWTLRVTPWMGGVWYTYLNLIPIGLMVYSFWGFRGNKVVHLLHGLTLFFGWYMILVGAMMASNVWL